MKEFIQEYFIAIIIGIIVLFILFFPLQIDFAISEGTFRGKVIDAEYTGLFWKNYVFHVQKTYNDTFNFIIILDLVLWIWNL